MSAVTTRRRPSDDAPVPGGGGRALAGAPTLIRFVLRRDRLRIPAWIASITLLNVATAVSYRDLYTTEQARQSLAETMASPAGIAMSGPTEYLADYSVGAIMGHQMLGFSAVLVALMSVLMVVRHTRAEEEGGRAELVRASVVGRHAHLAAALVVTIGANVVLAVLLGAGLAGLGIDGVSWAGSLLYGAAHAAVGVSFAAIAAVTAQITEHPRGAAGMALALLGAAYVLRAVGDVEGRVLSWLSPIGWAQGTYAYVDDRWWPLLLAVGLAAGLAAVAVALTVRRDLGAGLRQTRAGSADASDLLARPVGLALRLHRGLLIGFGAGLLLLGVTYGSVLPDVEAMLSHVEIIGEAIEQVGGASVVESFASMIMVVLAIITSAYLVLATLRPRAEEHSGRAEPLLATALSRRRWVVSHLAVAWIGGAGVMLLAGLGVGATGAVVLEDTGFAVSMLGAAAAYVPALWVVSGVTVALYGLAPRAVPLTWAVPVYAFIAGYLGQILQFPDWTNKLSPFGHVPRLPADDFALLPLVALTATAVALAVAGLAGFQRRGLEVN